MQSRKLRLKNDDIMKLNIQVPLKKLQNVSVCGQLTDYA